MTQILRRAQRAATWAVVVLILPVFGFSLFEQMAGVTTISGRPFWFFCGALVTGMFYLLVPRSLFWLLWVHESTHAFVAWLLGAELERMETDTARGGIVHYRFGREMWGQEFVALAPYFVQPVALLGAGVISIAVPGAHWWLSFLAGAGAGHFYFDLFYTLQAPQTDITKTGTVYATLIIVAMHLLWTGTVLCVIFPEASAGGFWVEGPAAAFEHVAALWR